MKRRILCGLLAISLLAGCSARTTESGEGAPPVDSGAIAYVPLDDRPDNAERVAYLAESLGYTLTMPEADWYQTKLDGQPLNENGTQYGDMAALYEWVLDQEAAGCNRYILSLDQLLSGGLVNSRHTAEALSVTLSDGTELTDMELLESVLTTLAADEDNRVWLLDTIMRLAPTCGYDGFGLEEYVNLRSYGMEPRPALSGDGLTMENILADYRLAAGGAELKADAFSLTESAVNQYLSARERKLRLSGRTQELLARPEYASFRLLVGIDDSSAEDSIQKNEIAFLRQNLRTAGGTQLDWVLSGVDDLAFKAVTRLYQEETGWTQDAPAASVFVSYYGGTEDRPACEYDYQPLGEVVAEHISFFGLQETSSAQQADLHVLVLTQPAETGQQEAYYQALIRQLQENERQGVPTILIDAGNNAYGTAFHDALAKECNLGWLLSYSGFLDMAIVTGTALSHGVARYAWLKNGNGGDANANQAFQRALTESIVLDFCYRNTVRDELSAYVRQSGGDPNNFYVPAIDLESVRGELEEGMAQSTEAVLKNLSKSNLILALPADQEGGTAGWGEVALSDWSFPWQRVFEVRMEIQIDALKSPHKSILGFTF